MDTDSEKIEFGLEGASMIIFVPLIDIGNSFKKYLVFLFEGYTNFRFVSS